MREFQQIFIIRNVKMIFVLEVLVSAIGQEKIKIKDKVGHERSKAVF